MVPEKPVRPRFDDPLPGEGGPLHREPPQMDGHILETAPPLDAPQAPGAPVPLLTDPSQQATQVLLDPTVTRMTLLLSNLVLLTENGDLAMWAALMTLDRVLRGLAWGQTPRRSQMRFFSLLQVTLARYSYLMSEHVEHLALLRDGEPDPPFPAWPPELSAEMYDLVDTMLPADKEGEVTP